MKKQRENKEERQDHINKLLDLVFDEPFGKKRQSKEERNKKSKPPKQL